MLIIKFQKGGKTSMEPSGYPGGECRKLTTHYAKHMAGEVKSDVPTGEACEPERDESEKKLEKA